MHGDQGRLEGEDREVLTMLDRAASRTAVPTWEPDLDAVVRRGTARRRRVQAGLTGVVAVAAAVVVGVTATVGSPLVESTTDVADRAPEVVGVDGAHPGPTTFDEFALDDGRCLEGRGPNAPDGRPVDVDTVVAAPLADAFVTAGEAEVGPTTVATVSRPPTLSSGSAPCGPSYTLEGTLDGAAYTATVTWTGAAGFVSECDPAAPAEACEALELDGATVVAQRDTVRGRVLLTVTREPDSPVAAGVAMGLSDLGAPVEQVARLLLAEDWHALADDVETAVVAADGEGTAPERLCQRGSAPVETEAAEPLVRTLESELSGLGVERAGPATVTRSRARYTGTCVQVLAVSLPVTTTSGRATVELTTGWYTDLFHALACEELDGCDDGLEGSYVVRTIEPPASERRQVLAAPGVEPSADTPAVSLAAEPGVPLDVEQLRRLAVGVDWDQLAEQVEQSLREAG